MKTTIENNITHPTFKLTESLGLIINTLVACENLEQIKNELIWLFNDEYINEYFEHVLTESHLCIYEKCTYKRIILIKL